MSSPLQTSDTVFMERIQLKCRGTLHWFHWIIIALSLLVTIGAWHFSNTQLSEKNTLQFEREADQVLDFVFDRMKQYEDGLWGGVGLIQAMGGDIDHRRWSVFAKAMHIEVKYPGINGIGVIHHVQPNTLDAYLREQRRERPTFAIHPRHSEKDYLPISYIFPVELNAAAVGLDIAHETNRYAAAQHARDTGVAQITGPITLVQDENQTPGFLFYAPFYRGGRYESVEERQRFFTGLVYAPFVVKKLMQGTLAKHKRRVSIRITDQGEVLYDEHVEHDPAFDPQPLFTKKMTVALYGRDWTFDIRSEKAFRATASNNQPITILIGGLVIDSLLLALFIMVVRGRRNALNYADRAKQDLQLILNSAGEGICGLGLDGRATFVNPSAATMLGYEPEELLGLPMHATIHHTKSDGSFCPRGESPMFAAYKDGKVHHGLKDVLWRKDGTSFPIEYQSRPIRNDQNAVVGAVVTFKDITERQTADDVIHKKNKELETLLYVTSHDLGEPLRAIQCFSQIVYDRYAEHLDVKGQGYLQRIVQGTKRMSNLLSEILTLARAQRLEPGNREIQSSKVVKEALVRLQETIEETHAIILVAPELPCLRADQTWATQAVYNLIANALKFTSEGNAPDVEIVPYDRMGKYPGEVGLVVRDRGPGVAPAHAERIFQIFQRAVGREVKGTGAGLAIVRQVAERHGGHAWVEPREGGGTEFFVTFGPGISTTNEVIGVH